MRRPIIGIVPLMDEERESYWMLPGYMKGIEAVGGLPIMLPLTSDRAQLTQLMAVCQGILLTGGHDVSPSLYHMEATRACGVCCTPRDDMETVLFQLALEQNKPVLGICRGIQLMNVLMGGTLYQDLPTEYSSKIEHHQHPPYDHPSHLVDLVKESPLYHLLDSERIMVNSYHHQAIKELASDLVAMAYSEDGLVEAVVLPKKSFVWAVQWHPEFSYEVDENSRKILGEFVKAAGGI